MSLATKTTGLTANVIATKDAFTSITDGVLRQREKERLKAAKADKKACFVLSVFQLKGGSGKSTMVKQLTAAIAARHPRLRILVIDVDQNRHQALRNVDK